MNLYAETTAVVGWLLGEAMGSSVRRALQSAESIFSSDLTLIEGDRALHRAAATGRISPDEVRRVHAPCQPGRPLVGPRHHAARRGVRPRRVSG